MLSLSFTLFGAKNPSIRLIDCKLDLSERTQSCLVRCTSFVRYVRYRRRAPSVFDRRAEASHTVHLAVSFHTVNIAKDYFASYVQSLYIVYRLS